MNGSNRGGSDEKTVGIHLLAKIQRGAMDAWTAKFWRRLDLLLGGDAS